MQPEKSFSQIISNILQYLLGGVFAATFTASIINNVSSGSFLANLPDIPLALVTGTSIFICCIQFVLEVNELIKAVKTKIENNKKIAEAAVKDTNFYKELLEKLNIDTKDIPSPLLLKPKAQANENTKEDLTNKNSTFHRFLNTKEIPDDLYCPFGCNIMIEPVFNKKTTDTQQKLIKNIADKTFYVEWLRNNEIDPFTNEATNVEDLESDLDTRNKLKAYFEAQISDYKNILNQPQHSSRLFQPKQLALSGLQTDRGIKKMQ